MQNKQKQQSKSNKAKATKRKQQSESNKANAIRLAVYGNMKIDSGMIGIASTSTPDYWIPMIVNMNFTKPKRANHSKIFSLQETN